MLTCRKGKPCWKNWPAQKRAYKAEAEKRLVQYGPNRLEEAKKDSFFKRLMKQLSDPMIIVLIAAAVVSGITSAYTNESFADVFIILFCSHYQRPSGHVSERARQRRPSRL